MIVCNRAVKWWGEKVKEAVITVRRRAHASYTSSKTTTTGWKEYDDIARKKLKETVDRKKKGV